MIKKLSRKLKRARKARINYTEGVGEIGYLPVVEKQAFAEGENVRNRRCLRSGTKVATGDRLRRRRRRVKRQFYIRPTLIVAKELLGKYLVRKIGSKKLVGKIVETEAYIGPEDRASHAFGGKITERCKTEYLIGGRIYIYLCYGIYWQLNITTEKAGKPECVLIRALEPLNGKARLKKVASGPGKLCRWLKLDKSFDEEDLTKSKRIWLEDRGIKIKESDIVATKRIGIDYAGSWAKKPWRFYLKDNLFISRP
ncbi:DNA-3-methyladenine glycosylase [Patescibacteria group bacterium]|nr:DNA-3-methyladenine glycosylase [Patescibacteria group bacterium]